MGILTERRRGAAGYERCDADPLRLPRQEYAFGALVALTVIPFLAGSMSLAFLLRDRNVRADTPLTPVRGLVCSNPNLDFGQLGHDKAGSLRGSFQLKNMTSRDIRVAGAVAQCTCVQARVAAKAVPPGGTAEVEVTADLSKMRGRVTEAILVRTDFPAAPFVRLALQADIVPELGLEPPGAHLGFLVPGQQATQRYRLVSARSNARITRVFADSPSVTVRPAESTSAAESPSQPMTGQAYVAEVTAPPISGLYRYVIVFRVDSPRSEGRDVSCVLTAEVGEQTVDRPSLPGS